MTTSRKGSLRTGIVLAEPVTADLPVLPFSEESAEEGG